MNRDFIPLWAVLAFMGCAGLLARALEAGDDWFAGPAAEWVGALGTVAAVVGAGWIAGAQGRREADRRAEDRRAEWRHRRADAIESLSMLEGLARHAAAVCRSVATGMRAQPHRHEAFLQFYPGLFRGMRSDLDGLLSLQPPGTGVRLLAFNIRGAVGAVAAGLEGAVVGTKGGPPDDDDLTFIFGVLESAALRLESHVGECRLSAEAWRDQVEGL